MSVLNAGSSSIASRCPPRVYSKRSATENSLGMSVIARAYANGDYHIDIMSRGVQVQQFSFWQWEQNLTDEDMHHEVMVGLANWCSENMVTFTEDGQHDFSFVQNKIAQAKSKIQH